jgi:hypothetical protein
MLHSQELTEPMSDKAFKEEGVDHGQCFQLCVADGAKKDIFVVIIYVFNFRYW